MKQYFTNYSKKPHLSPHRAKVFIVLLICAFIGIGSLFGQGHKGPQTSFCGTISQPDDYKKAAFFGNNQLLVDNLIKEGFNIDEDYLTRLEGTEEIFSTRENMITNQTNLRYIPVKAWIYRENNGTGNITLAELDQVIEGLNDLYSAQIGGTDNWGENWQPNVGNIMAMLPEIATITSALSR